jgi:hypothetical protein
MEAHVCLEHCERGIFITTEENAGKHHPESNPRMDAEAEKKILDEFEKANFEAVTEELSIAETQNFIFRKYNEDIIWAEPVSRNLNDPVILD